MIMGLNLNDLDSLLLVFRYVDLRMLILFLIQLLLNMATGFNLGYAVAKILDQRINK